MAYVDVALQDDYRQSIMKGEDSIRSKSNSYRSESSNSWHDYASPRDDESSQHKIYDSFDRGEGGSYPRVLFLRIAKQSIVCLISARDLKLLLSWHSRVAYSYFGACRLMWVDYYGPTFLQNDSECLLARVVIWLCGATNLNLRHVFSESKRRKTNSSASSGKVSITGSMYGKKSV